MRKAFYYAGGVLLGYWVGRYHSVSIDWWRLVFSLCFVIAYEFLLSRRAVRNWGNRTAKKIARKVDRGLLHVAEFFFGPRESWAWWQRRIERYRRRYGYDDP